MHLRKATFGDVEAIHKLVNDYAQQGVMLPRSRNSIYETLRDVIIAEEDDRLVGVGSLHLSWDALAEVRALAIAPGFQRRGIGSAFLRQRPDWNPVLAVSEDHVGVEREALAQRGLQRRQRDHALLAAAAQAQ